ncbi:MAG: DUF3987 domain-containing protein [Eubacteriales bacterium]|nr:DUF3987 domain-containing protein [Eubacteriales bacterium]
MLKDKPIIAYVATCRENTSNCLYPNRVEIRDVESAKEAFSFDCVFAQFKDNYRNATNFIWSNALAFDCDNDHSDNPKNWITPEDIEFYYADVSHIIHYSRHHMKQKVDKTPRPRFHVIFLIEPMTSESEYASMKKSVFAAYPFFDDNAIDSARLFFGTEEPEAIVVDGSITLNNFLAAYKSDEDFLLNYKEPIPEGKRNSTLTQIGARIIKRYGDTDDAYHRFLAEAERCDPPLDNDEVERIWESRKDFFKRISNLPGYVLPKDYVKETPFVWDSPIPFDEHELPSFPVEALPEVIRGYILAVSESTQTSVDMAAVQAIGIVALCGQGKYIIKGSTDWSEPLNVYLVIILPPAERKSSVMAMMTFPVEEYEKEVNDDLSSKIIESQMKLDALDKEKRALVDKVSKGKATEEELHNKAAEIARYKPVKPLRLFVDDVTSEKLSSVLAENNGKAAIVSAEGGIFDIISGLYNKNANIDVFLKGHSGDTIRVDRIGRESESIIHPALTILLAVQPEVLNGLMSNNTFRGRGLTARFLYSMPKSAIGTRTFHTTPIPEKAKQGYTSLVKSLLAENSSNEPIELSNGAIEILETLFYEVEGRLKNDLSDISDWAGKFVGAVLRIAGILHLAQNPSMPMFVDVSRETMENAVRVGKYFLEHAKAAYSLMGADPVNKNAEYLLAAIKRNQMPEFSRRDAMRLCRRFKTADTLQPVLNRLCEYGYIAPKPTEVQNSYGRKPSEVYLTNPAVLESMP